MKVRAEKEFYDTFQDAIIGVFQIGTFCMKTTVMYGT